MLPARIAAHYRDPDAVDAVDMNVRRLLQQHAGIFEMLHDIEEQMDYGMMDTTQLAEDGKTVIENDETMGVRKRGAAPPGHETASCQRDIAS